MTRPAGRTTPLPRAITGPWSAWIRDWADVLRLTFLVGAIVLALLGDAGLAVRLFLTFLVALVPRLIATSWPFDLAFCAAMSLQAWGNVTRVFWTVSFYHDIVHFLLTGATAILVYFLLVFFRFVPPLSEETHSRQKAGIATLTFAIGAVINAIYEQYEWFVDHLLNGHLLENYHHTMFDLFFGGLGSLAAGLWMAWWAVRKWLVRRPEGPDVLAPARQAIERRLDRHRPDRQREEDRAAGGRPPHSAGRTPIAGHWTRVVSDLARVSLLVGLILSAASTNTDNVVRFGVSLLVSLLVRRLAPPRLIELAFNGALLFEAWGALFLAYHRLPGYDDWTNFAVSLATTPVLYLALIRAHVFPEFGRASGVHRRVALFVAAMCLGFCAGTYYEQYVWLANHYLGATITTSWTGVARRLTLDWGGSAIGALLLVVWDAKSLGRRHEQTGPLREAGAGRLHAAGRA